MPPRSYGNFEILGELGRGGMGVVYKARDTRLNRLVALKLLRADSHLSDSRKHRFIQEARSASALNHPNIVTIYDLGEYEGESFIAMEYVDGKPLQQLIPKNGLPIRDVLRYAVPVAGALAAAHQAGLVHRDVKPANILIGANGVVKIVDFGIAKLAGMASTSEDGMTRSLAPQTEEGTVLGTPPYMPPEQVQGLAADARSDVFSLGAVLYEMATGKRPFAGINRVATAAAILREEPEPLTKLVPDLPREFERVVLRCLKKEPDRRFQHMADLKVALEELKEETDSGQLAAQAAPAPRRPATGRWIAVGSAASILTIALVGWFVSRRAAQPAAQPQLTRITSDGASFNPVVSRDGKFIAYSAITQGGAPEVWLQQIGGGKRKLFSLPEGAYVDDFSPEGTHVLVGPRAGLGSSSSSMTSPGELYEVPVIGGPVHLVSKGIFRAWYVEGGKRILAQDDLGRLLMLRRDGGETQPILQAWRIGAAAISPDARHFVVTGSRSMGGLQTAFTQSEFNDMRKDMRRWWIISLDGHDPVPVNTPFNLGPDEIVPAINAWAGRPGSKSGQFLYTSFDGSTSKVMRIPVDGNGKPIGPAEQLTGAAAFAYAATASETGRIAFDAGTIGTPVWRIALDPNSPTAASDRQRIAVETGNLYRTVSVSRDGAKCAYVKNEEVWVKDVSAGEERKLADAPNAFSAISPSGSSVLFTMQRPGDTRYGLYTVPTDGGSARKIGDIDIGVPKGISTDGSRVLLQINDVQSRRARVDLIDTTTGQSRTVLQHPKLSIWHPYYSWDDKWMTFKLELDPAHFQLFIIPVQNGIPASFERAIPLTDGKSWDDKPALSPDGDTLYFTSNRDRFLCIWAQKLDRRSKRPIGAPIAIHHFHDRKPFPFGNPLVWTELFVTPTGLITSTNEFEADIWMM